MRTGLTSLAKKHPRKSVTGMGFDVVGAFGAVVVEDMRPSSISNEGPRDITVQAYEANPPFAGNWALVAFAICADPLPGHTDKLVDSPSSSERTPDCDRPLPRRLRGDGHRWESRRTRRTRSRVTGGCAATRSALCGSRPAGRPVSAERPGLFRQPRKDW